MRILSRQLHRPWHRDEKDVLLAIKQVSIQLSLRTMDTDTAQHTVRSDQIHSSPNGSLHPNNLQDGIRALSSGRLLKSFPKFRER